MEFTVNQKELIQVLAQVKTMGVNYVKLTHCEKVLIIESFKFSKEFGNKNNCQFHFIIPSTGLCVDGEMFVNVFSLLSIVKNVVTEGDHIKIENRDKFFVNGNQFKIPTISKDEFMIGDDLYPKYKNFKKVEAKTLVPILKQATTFCSKDPTRRVLQNVSITNEEIASTDGHRLYINSLPVESKKDEPSQFPGKDVANLAKVLEKDKNSITNCGMALDCDFSLSWGTKNNKKAIVHCSIDSTTEEYPLYKGLMPSDNPITTIKANTKALKSGLKLLREQRTDKRKQVVLRISAENQYLKLCLLTEDKKEIQAETSLEITQKGKNIYLGANIDYVYEAVNLSKTKEITIEIRGSSRAIILLSDFYYLLMPIALDN